MSVPSLIEDAGGNSTILNNEIISGFVPNSTSRGTLDILWSCILTIIACVYTSIHLHIPPTGTSTWRRLGDKIRWAGIAIIAPELVLQVAVRQWNDSRHFIEKLEYYRKQYLNNDCQCLKVVDKTAHSEPFTMTYGFFAVMGGITVATDTLHDSVSKVTLSHRGILILAKYGHFINVSDSDIKDRSKANHLAKALVCTQVFWFCMQCIARKAIGYPLALLEIHTVVNVVCALLMYIFWWSKPLDIGFPIQVDDSKFRDIIALVLMSNKSFNTRNSSVVELSDITMHQALPPDQPPTPKAAVIQPLSRHEDRIQLPAPQEQITLEVGTSHACGFGFKSGCQEAASLTIKDQQRWIACARAISRVSEIQQGPFPILDLTSNLELDKAYPKLPQAARCDGIPDFIFDALPWLAVTRSTYSIHTSLNAAITQNFAVFILPVIYGGIHFAARNLVFPTSIEQLLWKVSCLCTMILPIGATTVHSFACWVVTIYCSCLAVYRGNFQAFKHSNFTLLFNDIREGNLLRRFFIFWGPLIFVAYAVCRVYIAVEAFIALRSMPLGVYATTPWLKGIPHV